MTDVNGAGDDNELAGKPLLLSIFPAIYKVDDAQDNSVSSSQGWPAASGSIGAVAHMSNPYPHF